MARKCPHCGTRVGQYATTCWQCKSPLEGYDSQSIRTDHQKKRGAKKIILAIIIILMIILACVFYVVYMDDDIGVFGTDYWFETGDEGEEVLKTMDEWTFELNIRQNYTLEGIILGTKYYHKHDEPYSPINTFSPIDILVGVDDVSDNVEKYDYKITSWENREVQWYLYYDDVSDYEYFMTHTGNNHLIPHNSEVYSKLFELKTGDRFTLSGYIVEPYGTKGNSWCNWPSDNKIGNYDCEVILVDSLYIE